MVVKPARTPRPPARQPQPKAPELQLAITSYGVKAVTGNRDFALFGAIATMLNNTKDDPNYEVPSPDGSRTSPAIIAPIPAFEDFESHERMMVGLRDVLLEATEKIEPHEKAEKKYLFLIIIPASVYLRYKGIDTVLWKELFSEMFSEYKNTQFHFLPADMNVTKNLQKAIARIDEGKLDSLVFAGCDSLVNNITCFELLQKRKLCSNEISNGIIPGEAAACVVIEKVDTATPKLALVKSLACAEEPNSGQAHLKKMTGLSEVIQSVIKQAGQNPDNLDCIIRNSTTEQHYEYEWYQVTQQLWPNTLSEQQRVAYQQGELDEPPQLEPRKMPELLKTSYTIGEVGAASMPLNMVLGGARFNFNYPTVKNCLICEANEFLFRGAILLENPHA